LMMEHYQINLMMEQLRRFKLGAFLEERDRRAEQKRRLPDQPACAVCLENFLVDGTDELDDDVYEATYGIRVSMDEEQRVLRCGHAFHRECIGGWLARGNTSCPCCRERV